MPGGFQGVAKKVVICSRSILQKLSRTSELEFSRHSFVDAKQQKFAENTAHSKKADTISLIRPTVGIRLLARILPPQKDQYILYDSKNMSGMQTWKMRKAVSLWYKHSLQLYIKKYFKIIFIIKKNTRQQNHSSPLRNVQNWSIRQSIDNTGTLSTHPKYLNSRQQASSPSLSDNPHLPYVYHILTSGTTTVAHMVARHSKKENKVSSCFMVCLQEYSSRNKKVMSSKVARSILTAGKSQSDMFRHLGSEECSWISEFSRSFIQGKFVHPGEVD